MLGLRLELVVAAACIGHWILRCHSFVALNADSGRYAGALSRRTRCSTTCRQLTHGIALNIATLLISCRGMRQYHKKTITTQLSHTDGPSPNPCPTLSMHRVEWHQRVYDHNTIAILGATRYNVYQRERWVTGSDQWSIDPHKNWPMTHYAWPMTHQINNATTHFIKTLKNA